MLKPLSIEQVALAVTFLDFDHEVVDDEVVIPFFGDRASFEVHLSVPSFPAPQLVVEAALGLAVPASRRLDLLEAVNEASLDHHAPQLVVTEEDGELDVRYDAKIALLVIGNAALAALLHDLLAQIVEHAGRVVVELGERQRRLAHLVASTEPEAE